MRNVWRLFIDDVKRLGGNVVTVIIALGLVALPSIFSWYNIIACWDVFENTGNLTVAVANSDEGYSSDLLPTELNIGDSITSALRANDQLDWVFTDEQDAIEGVRSGRYYASVVIPRSFSRDMMSFYSDDVEHARITYYSNQKKSAIAPKVTDQGADRVAAQVNAVFAETVSEIALGVSSKVLDYMDEAGLDGRIGDVARHVQSVGSSMAKSAALLGSYSKVVGSTRSLVDDTRALMVQADASADELMGPVSDMKGAVSDAVDAIGQASRDLDAAVSELDGDAATATRAVSQAFDQASDAANEARQLLLDQAALADTLGDSEMAKSLRESAGAIAAADESTQAARSGIERLSQEAREGFQNAEVRYDDELKPALDELVGIVEGEAGTVASAAATLDASGSDMAQTAASVSAKLAEAQRTLDDTVAKLGETASKLDDVSARIAGALESNDVDALRDILGSDPATLAAAVSAPVELVREAVYPVENFGSAMAPLYTTLALWIGALLLVVTLKVVPGNRSLRTLENPTGRQVFMGRFLVFALMSLMQSTMLSLGNMLFLGVQVADPLLYLLCFWVSGLVFVFIMYTLVALFANLGKGVGVVLLIVQVAGGGGSFPLQLLPQFFQDMSPFLPIAHAVNAMRAAMFGLYQGDYWMQLGVLVLFMVPFAVIGLALHRPLGKIVPKFVERVEQSELM